MNSALRFTFAALLLATTVATTSIVACGDGAGSKTSAAATTAVTSVATGTGGAGGDPSQGASGAGTFTVGQGGAAAGTGGSCADAVVEANVTTKPVDIIFVVDVSGSMNEEIAGIEQNINNNFAQIIGASGVDYRIILLVDHGPGTYEVCVEEPLSTIAKGGCKSIGMGAPGNNNGKFYHYSLKGLPQSNDSLCLILETLYGARKDDYNLAPNGWIEWLRPEAAKTFVLFSDDRPKCTWFGSDPPTTFDDKGTAADGKKMALDFDKALLGLAPQQFGTSAARNYQFYSLVGLESKSVAKDSETMLPIAPNASPLEPYSPLDPVTDDKCKSAYASGHGYQYLSKGTNGLRFPVCDAMGYDVIFKKLAQGVVAGSKVPCTIELPEPKDGQELDLKTVSLVYTPGDMSVPKELTQVDSMGACVGANDKFYIDKVEGLIQLCPETCKLVEADSTAKVQVKVECGGSAF
ncbi:MAG: hypothetical protein FJ096_07785 [Deltaproteobacteria bacterium]|nr:hypothetical protein [Deltaproteobacteria bacterium]